jgi:hypothetical protein
MIHIYFSINYFESEIESLLGCIIFQQSLTNNLTCLGYHQPMHFRAMAHLSLKVLVIDIIVQPIASLEDKILYSHY